LGRTGGLENSRLSDEIVAHFETLERIDRSISVAANLFFYDSTEAYINPESLTMVCDQAAMISGQLLQINSESSTTGSLRNLESLFKRLSVAVDLYTAAEREFSSDREILSGMLNRQLAEVLNILFTLQMDGELMKRPANRNLLASLEELGHVLDDLLRQFENSTVHQPQTIVAILARATTDLNVLEQRHQKVGHEDIVPELKALRDDIRLLGLNLLGIYNIWTFDPNLSCLGDEIEKLRYAWDRIQFSMNVIIDAESGRFENQRKQMAASATAAKVRFAGLAGIGLIMAIIFAISLRRVLNRRLVTLAEGMKSYADGNWDARLEVREDGELAQLSEAFNEMAVQLQLKDEELNQTIEILVDSQAEPLVAC